MQISKKKLIALMVASFVTGGIIMGTLATLAGAVGSSNGDKYSKMDEIYTYIENGYYKETNMDELMEGAYKGLVQGLEDPYSAYMTKDEYSNWITNLQGEYSGIGVTFTQDMDGAYIVVSVETDSPAEKAGIEAGDIILKVNGETYDDMDLLANAIRGKEGTSVEITYARDGKQKTAKITRAKITQKSVSYEMVDDQIAYIAITSFMDTTSDDFKKALEAVEEKGAKKLILDLRDNGGGLLTSCVEIADEFLDSGVVVYVEDRNGERTDYEAKNGKTDLKTVVLINENSASAAEILAAALQDNGFKLVGNTSFGKGIIQSTVELDDGSALKLTIMQYFSPDGNVIHEKGVTPDYKVKNKGKSDNQIKKAKEILNTL